MPLLIVLLIVVLLFGAAKLPDLARNLGKSMKIMKDEVKDLREDGAPVQPTDATANPGPGPVHSVTDAAPSNSGAPPTTDHKN